MLAFDKHKYRLGYGKGFYDRYLNKYLKKFKNILTVGVAFSFQKHHKLPRDKNDVKLKLYFDRKRYLLMKILILGDVMGFSGREAINKKLPNIIKKYKTDFIIVNGENAANDGRGITKDIAEEFFAKGVDVITSGNHIWDKEETTNYH